MRLATLHRLVLMSVCFLIGAVAAGATPEEVALERLRATGAKVEATKDRMSGHVVAITLHGVTDAAFEGFGPFRHLRQLDIFNSPRFTGSGLSDLPVASQLQDLCIEKSGFDDAGALHLPRFVALDTLVLHDTAITGKAIESVGRLLHLRCLEVTRNKAVRMGEYAAISGLTDLRQLVVDDSDFGDSDVRSIAHLRKLRTLSMNNTKVTDGMLPFIQSIAQPERPGHRRGTIEVHMVGTSVSREELEKVKGTCPNLFAVI